MKKTLLILLALTSLFGFSACEKTEVVETIMPNRTYVRDLVPGNWIRESANTIRYDIPLLDLDEYYMLNGNVAVALSLNNEDTYDILPSTFEGVAYSVSYAIGSISIYAQDPIIDEGIEVPFPTGTYVAKIVLSESDFID